MFLRDFLSLWSALLLDQYVHLSDRPREIQGKTLRRTRKFPWKNPVHEGGDWIQVDWRSSVARIWRGRFLYVRRRFTPSLYLSHFW